MSRPGPFRSLMVRPLAVFGLVVSVAAAACSGSGGGQTLDDLDDLEQPQQAAEQDLRVAVGEDPFRTGDNPNIGLLTDGPNPGIFDTLTRLTARFTVVPSLATTWESPSPREWRFTLRENVTFHDGTPFDAAAVVDNLERIASRNTRPRGLDPGSARVAGPHEVELSLSLDNARLAEQLANPSLAILAPGTEPGAGEDPSTTPTGTGPFRFVDYLPDQQLRMIANDEYWDEPPVLRSLTFVFGPDADAGRLLATRQVHAVGHIAHEHLPALSGNTDRRVTSDPAHAVYVLLNTGGIGPYATLQDVNVRQAVAMSIDRDAIAEEAWPEHGEPNRSLIPEVVLGDEVTQRVSPVARDVEGAKQLLARSGWAPGPDGVRVRDGEPLVLTVVLSRSDEQQPAVAPLRRSLAEAGIGLDVADLAGESSFLRLRQSAFDLYLETRVQLDANPCALCGYFTREQGGVADYSDPFYGGSMADELFAQAYAAPSPDTARRLAGDLMDVVVADAVTAVPLASLPTEWLVSPRVKAFVPAALPGDQRWDKVWLSV